MSLADPGLALVLDPRRLAELVGQEVRVSYVRPKPGVSTVAALATPEGMPWGWVRTLSGDAVVKAGKTRRNAEAAGLGDRVGQAALTGRDTVVEWGPVVTDPRLVRTAAALDPAPGDVLRHNPLRRLVARDGDLVVRVTAGPHRSRLTHVADDLAAAGVPVLTSVRVGPDRPQGARVSWWPWVEGVDASALVGEIGGESGAGAGGAAHGAPGVAAGAMPAADDVLHEAGRVLGLLHSVPPSRVRDLPARGWAEALDAARAAVGLLEAVAPGAAGSARRVLDRLPVHARAGAPVAAHGDLSLDQLLVRAGSGEVVLTDLDRAAAAPAELDLASLAAADLLEGHRCLGPLAEGYAATTGTRPHAPGPWVAAAVLARVAEPWRHQQQGWPGEIVRRSLLADRVLGLDDVWAGPGRVLEVAR